MNFSKFSIFAIRLIILSISFSCERDKEFTRHEEFISDTIVILNYFDEPEFESDIMPSLLNEIGICKNQLSDTNSNNLCSPRNYKFFKYNNSLSWNDGFGLEIRATVDNFALRRFILFERISGKLVKMQGFVANLAEMHTTPSGYNDLMLLFPDKEAGSFVVKYTYDLEDKIYKYQSLEAIDGYLVRKDRKDSLSNVVLQRLNENRMFF